jgi:hypothetical protein
MRTLSKGICKLLVVATKEIALETMIVNLCIWLYTGVGTRGCGLIVVNGNI